MKNNTGLFLITLACMLALALTPAIAQSSGLIITLPGQKQIDKASATVHVNPVLKKKPGKKPSGAFIPLPSTIKKPKPVEPKKPENNDKANEKPLIQIIPVKPVDPPVGSDNFPTPPDEITISSGDSFNDLLPAPAPPEAAVSSDSSNLTMPVFPKDTSSAIFMVMKTWQCDNYDGNTLLSHAAEVYGKEADDFFKIQGLDTQDPSDFLVSVEEEDITFDELLDILSSKSGRDWGVDIPSKIIYFYPKGVKTEAYNVW